MNSGFLYYGSLLFALTSCLIGLPNSLLLNIFYVTVVDVVDEFVIRIAHEGFQIPKPTVFQYYKQFTCK